MFIIYNNAREQYLKKLRRNDVLPRRSMTEQRVCFGDYSASHVGGAARDHRSYHAIHRRGTFVPLTSKKACGDVCTVSSWRLCNLTVVCSVRPLVLARNTFCTSAAGRRP
jgi:hypothetical protein